jgi:hypothetical protein
LGSTIISQIIGNTAASVSIPLPLLNTVGETSLIVFINPGIRNNEKRWGKILLGLYIYFFLMCADEAIAETGYGDNFATSNVTIYPNVVVIPTIEYNPVSNEVTIGAQNFGTFTSEGYVKQLVMFLF